MKTVFPLLWRTQEEPHLLLLELSRESVPNMFCVVSILTIGVWDRRWLSKFVNMSGIVRFWTREAQILYSLSFTFSFVANLRPQVALLVYL